MFFDSLAEFSLGFTYICVAAVDVTHDVIEDITLILPAIYNQIIPPKSEATHVTPVREQGP